MPRVPDEDPGLSDARPVAERVAGAVRRHVLAAAQASLRALREMLAQIPTGSGAPPPAAPPASAEAQPVPKDHQHGARPSRPAPSPLAPPPPSALLHGDATLPDSYGSDRLVLIARDPHCLYAYWDLSETRVQSVRGEAGSEALRIVLRAFDVTQVSFDAKPPSRFQDFSVTGDTRSIYAYVGKPAACFVAEVGVLRPDGAFFPFARSQPVWTPRTDQPGAAPGRWMTVGWSERPDAGEVMPLATTGNGSAEPADTGLAATTRRAPSSWPGPAPSAAQRGSWSLVRGKLATATGLDDDRPVQPDDQPGVRSDP